LSFSVLLLHTTEGRMSRLFDFFADILRGISSFIIPQTKQGNCTLEEYESDPPPAYIFLSKLEEFQVVFLALGAIFTLAVLILSLIQWYYVWTYISLKRRRNKLYFLISLFPVSTACCLIGMFCPRTAVLVSSLGLLYFLTCLFVLVSLIRHLADGRAQLALVLTENDQMINFQSPPFCCCLPCLPKVRPTERNLRRLEWIVLQAPIVRVFIVIGEVIAVAERREHALNFIQICDAASLASLMLAIFGIHTLARLTSDRLSRYGFMGIFRMVNVALVFFSAQQLLLFQNVFLRFGLIGCGPVLSPQDNARFICKFVIICELLLLSVLSTFWSSPSRNSLFDLYRGGSSTAAGDALLEK
jgi:organic solute transporter subunit alpha